MVILKRISMGPMAAKSAARERSLQSQPEVWMRPGDERESARHAALLKRLGFSDPQIYRLLATSNATEER